MWWAEQEEVGHAIRASEITLPSPLVQLLLLTFRSPIYELKKFMGQIRGRARRPSTSQSKKGMGAIIHDT